MPLDTYEYNRRVNELLKDNPYAAEADYPRPTSPPALSTLADPTYAEPAPFPSRPSEAGPLALSSLADPSVVEAEDHPAMQGMGAGPNTLFNALIREPIAAVGQGVQAFARDPIGTIAQMETFSPYGLAKQYGFIDETPGEKIAEYLTPEEPIAPVMQAGEAITEYSQRPGLQAAPGWEHGITDTVGGAFGVTGLFLATGALGKAAMPAGALMGSYMAAGQAFDEAVRQGATPEQIKQATRMAGMGGMSEPLPIEVILNRIPMPLWGKATTILGKILTKAAAEGGQEVLQQGIQNFSEKYAYNPDQDLSEGMLMSFGLGSLIGGTFATPGELASGFAPPAAAPGTPTSTPPGPTAVPSVPLGGVTSPALGVTTPAGTPPSPPPGGTPGVTTPAPGVTTPVVPPAPPVAPAGVVVDPEDELPPLLPDEEEEEAEAAEAAAALPAGEVPVEPVVPATPPAPPAPPAAAPVAGPWGAPAAPAAEDPATLRGAAQTVVPPTTAPLTQPAIIPAPEPAAQQQQGPWGARPAEQQEPPLSSLAATGSRRFPATDAAGLAAASQQVNEGASDAQRLVKNAQIGHYRWQGREIGVEVPAGGMRHAVDRERPKGEEPAWRARLPEGVAYGRIKGTRARDGQEIDVYLGPDPDNAPNVYLIDQVDADTGKYDEPKPMVGFGSLDDAINAYREAFDDGRGDDRIGAVSELPVADFKTWLGKGNTLAPYDRKATAETRRARQAEAKHWEEQARVVERDARLAEMHERRAAADEQEQAAVEHAMEGFTDEEKATVEAAAPGIRGEPEPAGPEYAQPDQAVPDQERVQGEELPGGGAVAGEPGEARQPGPEGGAVAGPEEVLGAGQQVREEEAEPVGLSSLAATEEEVADAEAIRGDQGQAEPEDELRQGAGARGEDLQQQAPEQPGDREPQGERPQERTQAEELGDVFDEAFAEGRAARDTKAAKTELKRAGLAAKAAARETVLGLRDAALGLEKLFHDPNRVGSGPVFDEVTYAKAKPFFKTSLAHFKTAGASLSDMMRALVRYLLNNTKMTDADIQAMKPYAVRFIEDVGAGRESIDAPVTGEGLERDREDAEPADQLGEEDVPAGAGRDGPRAGGGGEAGGEGAGRGLSGGSGLPKDHAPVVGADGSTGVPERKPESDGEPRRRDIGGRGSDPGQPGLPADRHSEEEVTQTLSKDPDLGARLKAQKAAEGKKVKYADLSNIAETVPLLTSKQHDDVLRAEKRLDKHDGFLLTNGTGTGKTFSGLGVVKRAVSQGKKHILVLAPSQGILSDWKKTGKLFGLDIEILEDTQTHGKNNVVITTYANLQQNPALAKREWDLVVADEAQKLTQNQKGEATQALHDFRSVTRHPRGLEQRAKRVLDKEWTAYEQAPGGREATAEQIARKEALYEAWRKKAVPLMQKWQGEPRAKVVMMSATPFSYVTSLDYAEGYLFDYPKAPAKGSYSYNAPDDRDLFYIRNFGYRMRNNKLTKPDADVRNEVMERQFHEKLRGTGALWGRIQDEEYDYDRKFALLPSKIGTQIDDALKFLLEADDGKFKALWEPINKRFDYLARMRLLEAIKAKEAIPYIKKHLALGRQVVVFHDYNEGGGMDPFELHFEPGATAHIQVRDAEGVPRWQSVRLKELYDEFVRRNPEVGNLKFGDYPPPIQAMREAFPNALLYNGQESVKKRIKSKDRFNDDLDTEANLIVLQSAAGEYGISLHDTTGKHQRVMINLGMPVRPTTALQQEGRTYRYGQKSNAPMRYLNTGTNWERWTFAGKIAERAGTAENLALGNLARTIRQSFIDAFNASAPDTPGAGDGVGGKQLDRSFREGLTEFEKAKTYYFGEQKKAAGRGAREGTDYFPTPEPLGLKMVEWANARPGEHMLEPSAGHGAISRFFPQDTHRLIVEPSDELGSRASLATLGARYEGVRFEDLNIWNKADAIVMNPPFGTGGKTAFEHVAKAVKHLNNRGRIVALLPSGPSFEKRWDEFQKSAEAEDIYLVGNFLLPAVTFERAGTKVTSQILVLEKRTRGHTKGLPTPVEEDFSGITKISELFDRIENLTVEPRQAVEGRTETEFSIEDQGLRTPSPERLQAALSQERGLAAGHVSTRQTEAEKLDPTGELSIRAEHVIRSPNINLVGKYLGMGFARDVRNAADLGAAYVKWQTDNLLYLFRHIDPAIRAQSKEWYVGAHALSHIWAKVHKIPSESVAAVMAVLSPQKDWFENASLAQRILDINSHFADEKWDQSMTDMFWSKKNSELRKYRASMEAIKGKKLSDIVNDEDLEFKRALWIRMYDEAHLTRGFRELHPSGDFGPYQTTDKTDKATGKPALAKVSWGSLTDIEKADEAYHSGGDMKVISGLLGDAHKVRSFFDNINIPWDVVYKEVTGDTHAGAASHFQPLSQTSPAVSHLLGSGLDVPTQYKLSMQALAAHPDKPAVRRFLERYSGTPMKTVQEWEQLSRAARKRAKLAGRKYRRGRYDLWKEAWKEAWEEAGGVYKGPSKVKELGVKGSYGLVTEAYREAADIISEEEGEEYLPREIQSITWEGIRALFTPERKRDPVFMGKMFAIWEEVDAGKRTAEQARAAILRAAGEDGKVAAPGWSRPGFERFDPERFNTYEGRVSRPSLVGGGGLGTGERSRPGKGAGAAGRRLTDLEAPQGWEGIESAPVAEATPEQVDDLIKIVERVAGEVRMQFAGSFAPQSGEGAAKWGQRRIEAPAGYTQRQYTPDGRLLQRVIGIALHGKGIDELLYTTYHEAFHAVQEALGQPNARVLKAALPAIRKLMVNVYGAERAAKIADTEMLAVAFGLWAKGRHQNVHIGLRKYFQAIKEFLRRIAVALKPSSRTAEDVFGDIYRGKLAAAPQRQSAVFDAAGMFRDGEGFAEISDGGGADTQFDAGLPRRPPRKADPGATFARPAETRVRRLERNWADREEAAWHYMKALKATGQKVAESLDLYKAMGRFYGRAGGASERLEDQTVKPIMDAVRATGRTVEDFGKYLYAAHAGEANAYLRTINLTLADPSGMSDADAAAILAAAHPEFASIAQMVYAMNKEALWKLYQEGLIDADTYNLHATRYQKWVPLRGWENAEGEDFFQTGKGFDLRAAEFQQRLGRMSEADNPFAYSIMNAQTAIVRSEKNRVGRILLRLVRQFKNSEVWSVDKAELKPVFNKVTKKVEYRWVPPAKLAMTLEGRQRVFVVKEGGVPHYVTIHDNTLLQALRMMGSEEVAGWLRHMGKFLRVLSKMYTTLAPTFIVSNLVRDWQTAMINVQEEDRKNLGVRVTRRMPKASMAMWSYLGGAKKPATKADNEMLWYAHEFVQDGGKISYVDMRTIEDQKKRLKTEIEGNKYWRGAKTMMNFVEQFNGAGENAVRLALYVELRTNQGYTRAEAATVAREITTNFNRKGMYGQAANSLFIFFNARVQGMMKVARFTRNAVTNPRKYKKSAAALYMLPALGFVFSALNRAWGGDDEDGLNRWDHAVQQHEKERFFILLLPDGKTTLKFPMSYGFNMFFVAGQQAEAAMANMLGYGDGTDPVKAVINVLHASLNATSPVDIARWGLTPFTPTLAAPFVEMAENRTFRDTPIYPTKYDPRDPDAQLFFRSTPWPFKVAARELEEWTRYSAKDPAAIDVSPESLQHLWTTYTSGMIDFWTNKVGVNAAKLLSGRASEIERHQIPFTSILVGTTANPFVRQDMYYDIWEQVDVLHERMTAATPDQRAAMQRDNPAEANAWRSFTTAEKRLRQQRDLRKKIDASPMFSGAEKKRRLSEVEDAMDDIRSGALEAYGAELKRQQTLH